MSKLIPKHLNGNPIIPKYYGAYDYKKDKWVLPAFNDSGETHITLPNIEITPRNTNLTEVVDRGRDNVGRAVYDMSTYVTPTGDALDAFLVKKDLLSGNYGLVALGAGLLLLPNIIEKPIKGLVRAGKKAYNTGKDLVWLTKRYNEVGTGLTNPYVRKEFLDVAKNPTLTRLFIERFSTNLRAFIDLKTIKSIYPKLLLLESKYKFTPKYSFNDWTPINNQLQSIENTLETSKRFSDNYYSQLDYLKNNNKVLYDIAEESPQYLLLIYLDVNSGKVSNLEDYVKSLVEQSGTFIRRMNLPHDADFVNSFGTIAGKSMGHKGYALDVGEPNVVLNSIFARGYGKDIATYTPKLDLQGPVETWWSLRIPKIDNVSINTNGMHTDRFEGSVGIEGRSNIRMFNDYLDNKKVPVSYGRTASHMVFTSPTKGTSILDYYNITPGFNPNLRYTLGHSKGGNINHK